MTRQYGYCRHGSHCNRTILLLLIIISALLIVYYSSVRSKSETRSNGLFFEDFGDTNSNKESMYEHNAKAGNKDNSPDQALEHTEEQPQAAVEATEAQPDQPLEANQQEQGNQENFENKPDQNVVVKPDDKLEIVNPETTESASDNGVTETPEQASQTVESSEQPLTSAQNSAEDILEPMPSTMPRIMHHRAASEILPVEYQSIIDSCLSKNADWKYFVWRDKDRDEFIRVRYPEHIDWFSDQTKPQQDQLFRFFVLKVYGGIFLDIDMECAKPFEPTLTNATVFVAKERPERTKIVRNIEQSADISAVAGMPEHELFTKILEALSTLPKETADATSLLTNSFDEISKAHILAAGEDCKLQDYHYFGAALDNTFQWQEECHDVLAELQQMASPYEPGHELYNKQQGCIQLRDKDWLLVDISNETLAFHRFPKVSITDNNSGNDLIFNLTIAFGNRVTYYV